MIDIHSRFYIVENALSIYVKEMRLTNKHLRRNNPALEEHYNTELRKLDRLAVKAFTALYDLQTYAVGQAIEKRLMDTID